MRNRLRIYAGAAIGTLAFATVSEAREPGASQPAASPLAQFRIALERTATESASGPADAAAAARRVLDSGDRRFAKDDYGDRMEAFVQELQKGDARYRGRLIQEILARKPGVFRSWLTSERADKLAREGHITPRQRSLIAEVMDDPAVKVLRIKALVDDQGTGGIDRRDHMKEAAKLLTSGDAANIRAVLSGLSEGDLARLAKNLEHRGLLGKHGLHRNERDDLFNAIAGKADTAQLLRLMQTFGDRVAADPNSKHEPIFDMTGLLVAVGNSAPADVKTAFLDALAKTHAFSAVSRLGRFKGPDGTPVWQNEDQRFALASMLLQDPALTPAGLARDQDMARLAVASYISGTSELSGKILDHYQRVTNFTSDRRLKDLSASDFSSKKTGFDAALFRDKRTGGYVLSFRGSDSKKDYGLANVPQAIGLPSLQYAQAISLAGRLKDVLGADLTDVTGHSLGGGLAAAAGMSINTRTTTFDAAGLNPLTLAHHSADGDDDIVTNYRVRGELLSHSQEKSFASRVVVDAVGKQITIEAFERAGPNGQMLSHRERKNRKISTRDLHGDKYVVSGMLINTP